MTDYTPKETQGEMNGLTVPSRDSPAEADGYLRTQSASCRISKKHNVPSSSTAECNSLASGRDTTLPKRNSQPSDQYPYSPSSHSLEKFQKSRLPSKCTHEKGWLSNPQIITKVSRNSDSELNKSFDGNIRSLIYSHFNPYISQLEGSSERLLCELLQENLTADEQASSYLACKELRCPKTCTNWKAHSLFSPKKTATPVCKSNKDKVVSPFIANCSPQPFTSTLSTYQPVQFTYGNRSKSSQRCFSGQKPLSSNKLHLSNSDLHMLECESKPIYQPPSNNLPLLSSSNHLPISHESSLHCEDRFPSQTTKPQICPSQQPELVRHRENFWSSHGDTMAKGYVRAWAEQINHHGPPVGNNTEEQNDGGVRTLVRKLSQNNLNTECQMSPQNGKEMLSGDVVKGDKDSLGSNNVHIRDALLQSVTKAANQKKNFPKCEMNSKDSNSSFTSTTQWQTKVSPTTQKKHIQPGISQTLEKLNIDCSLSPKHSILGSPSHSPSHVPRKLSEPPPWSHVSKSQDTGSDREGSPQSKTSPKSKPPVDYSRKPSLDITKKPLLSPKRPSLPSQTLLSKHDGSIMQLSVCEDSISASSPRSSPQPSPPLCIPKPNGQSSHDLVYQNMEHLHDATNKSSNLDATDYADVFYPESKSSVSSPSTQISVSPAPTSNVEASDPKISNCKTSTLEPEPVLRLRSSPGRSCANSEYTESVLKTIYDNGPALSAAELFDSSWSDSDSVSNEFGGENEEDEEAEEKIVDTTMVERKESSQDEDAECETPTPSPVVKTEAEKTAELESKRQHIVQELLKTERDYVARLHLLHHVFFFRLDKENRQHAFIPADMLSQMFSNIKSIYTFHHDFLLQQIEEKVENWDQDPRIGHILEKNAPFLKMYSQYIANFDNAMKLIDQWTKKSSKFSNIIKAVQELPECGSLSLQHHMLEPIQRVPRYEMLIKDYMKTLPEDSPDLNDAKAALDLVTKAANHSNRVIKKIEEFRKLLDIYQNLKGVPLDFISPTREFITQGPVTKIAARSGEKLPRQLFLFNDLILVCAQYNAILGTFNVRSQLEMDSIEIKPGNNMNIANTFRVHSKQKAVELLDEDQSGSSFGWEQKISDQLNLYKEKKRSIKHGDSKENIYESSMPDSWVGKTAPVWIPDDAATMCMLCEQAFNVLRRRHHCRACGKLLCRSCSGKKAPLQYNKGKIERVCNVCYDIIVNKQPASGADMDKKKGLLQVKASEPALMSGYVQCSEDNGSSWHRMWIAAHKDFVLYSFKAHEDVSAISCRPLPGHEVKQVWDIEGRPQVFSLTHKQRVISQFQPQNEKQLKRWMNVLGKLVQAELPDENQRQSTNSNGSNVSSDCDSSIRGDDVAATILTVASTSNTTITSSASSSSHADSGFPTDDGDGGSGLDPDPELNSDHNHSTLNGCLKADHEDADKISQYDNVDAVISDQDHCSSYA